MKLLYIERNFQALALLLLRRWGQVEAMKRSKKVFAGCAKKERLLAALEMMVHEYAIL